MHSTRSRLSYLAVSAGKMLSGRGLVCPSCTSTHSTLVARKYGVTALRRCSDCQLLFRTPTTSENENASFYQTDYSQGLTSDCPPAEQLEQLKATAFSTTELHYRRQIDVLRALGCQRGTRIFDYGCSWGYGSWQLAQAGYDVFAFEISIPRATYARESLGIDVATNERDLHGPCDVFFSNHVLEHVPSVAASVQLARRMLRPGGWFVAFTPNGSDVYRRFHEFGWMKSWGLVHPNLLDDKFYVNAFGGEPVLTASGPYDYAEITRWAQSGSKHSTSLDLTGYELLAIAQLSGTAGQ